MRRCGAVPSVDSARGFTLIEMLVVLVLLGLLAAMAHPMVELAAQRQKEHELRAALRTIRDGLDAYKRASDEGRVLQLAGGSGYPPQLSALVEGVRDARSPAEKRIFFLRRLPRDPFAPTDMPAEDTWGLRSYESPPDRPEPGADVYDVYSRSTRRALDGTTYSQW